MQPLKRLRAVNKLGKCWRTELKSQKLIIYKTCYNLVKKIKKNYLRTNFKFVKKNLRLALLSGLLFVLAWPIDGFAFLIFFAFIPLLLLESNVRQEQTRRSGLRVFGYSYLMALIWNLGTTWWLVNASVFGMLFANLCNSSFYAILITVYHWSAKRLPQRSAYIFLIALWLSFEKGHLLWDFSWPWLNLGNVFSESIHWIQWYEYTGAFGGTLWVLVANILGFQSFKSLKESTPFTHRIKSTVPWLLIIAIPIIISLLLYQNVELTSHEIKIAVTQPNIDPYNEKYNFSNAQFLDQLKVLTQEISKEPLDFIFTPETYFASGLGEELATFGNNSLYNQLETYAKEKPETLFVTGIQFYDIYVGNEAPTETANKVRDRLWVDYYNSALAFHSTAPYSVYHKSKLVVGVENMPYKKIFQPLLGSFMIDLGGTVSSRAIQSQRTVFEHPNLGYKVGPIICYESIYGEFVTEYVRKGAHFLGVITNDAWWGNTPGHRQLLSYTRLRAIENRRGISRSANTGISSFIDPKGAFQSRLDYDTKGLLVGTLPKMEGLTFYTRYGDYLARIAVLIAALYFLLALSGRLKNDV